ncbi:MAG: LLM class flavin-dependent oxidoreductase [Pseudomonadota bacterium]|nr:LLM class flavin-dependent oxidoreductase [Pseudomonadota bacterium]
MAKTFQFGLALRTQYPMEADITQKFEDLLQVVRLADELGYNSLTKTSHYSTAPYQAFQQFPILARLSAEAPNLRLNAGIILLSLHKPLDIAEQLATIDVMCGGKLIVGAALGYREVELKAFGTNRRERAKRFEENLIAIKRLWTEDSVDMVGSHFELSGATCLPKPFQNPHPPIWIGANADPAIERAARMGDCWYINPHNEISTVIRQMEIYKRALDAANKPFPDELPMRREVFVAPTKAEALRLCGPYLAGKYENYTDWGQSDELPDDDSKLDQAFDELIGDRFLLGSPDEVAEQIIDLHRKVGTNHLIMSMDWAGMPQEATLDCMRLFAAEVAPKVKSGL